MSTVLLIPFLNVYVAMVICDPDSPINKNTECYGGIHMINLCIASIGLLILLLFVFLISFFFINLNPFSPVKKFIHNFL